jgi:hypothetical protein
LATLRASLTGLTLALFPLAGPACQTPVFRYALERWHPGTYEMVVFHRGSLSTNDQAVVKRLQDASLEGQGSANYSVETVDLERESRAELLQLWRAQTNATLPWLAVRYPGQEASDPCAWSAPLAAENARAILDSPVRREFARQISTSAAVWLLIESANPAQNEAVRQRLETELKKCEKTVEVPLDPDPDSTNVAKLNVRFPLVRVAPGDAAEAGLLSLLRGQDPEFAKLAEPYVLPVFGRGRVLCMLPASKATAEVVQDIAGFLLGPCSCQVKEQNPGFDLLVSADWDAALAGGRLSDPPASDLPALGSLAAAAAPAPAAAAAATNQPGDRSKPRTELTRNLTWLAGGGVALVALASIILLRSRKSGGRS